MTLGANENFLHTTHRTVSWFRKAYLSQELELSAPFQRNPVWTTPQKAYLIDTILNALPIPELYMQDLGDEDGKEKHIVVDGQQRIRSVLEFIEGKFVLEGEDVTKKWRKFSFEDLTGDEKKIIFAYKFVVRILPPIEEEAVRKIFSRLNRNVVALNEQELRNATYWGPFIKTIRQVADEDQFWSEAGIFSANDHRRMLDHEYISELAIAHLHGPQNKKDKLDTYYQLYEENFEDEKKILNEFMTITKEIDSILPNLKYTRWKKRSDFYSMFLSLGTKVTEMPFSSDRRDEIREKVTDFGYQIDATIRLEEKDWQKENQDVISYARAVARAASDRANRVAREAAFKSYVFNEKPAK